MQIKNIFDTLPADQSEEVFEHLAGAGQVKIERIISKGHRSPDGFWYDQEQDEWVLLLRGSASLLFENRAEPVRLSAGDYLHIPAHARHRIESTSTLEPTIWLAVFF